MALRYAPAGEGVLICARGGVVSLAAVAEDGAGGGEDEEEIEVGGEKSVEMIRSMDFWAEGVVIV